MRLPRIDVDGCVRDLLKSLQPQKSRIHRVILFGSAARGEITGFSDLDVVVIEETDEPFLSRLQRYYGQIDVPCDLDLLVYTPEEFQKMKKRGNPLIRRVLKEGRVIYEKRSSGRG